jgi:hypothetical protein
MLWSEKVHFVTATKFSSLFPPTDFYGWCDIGYFRDRPIHSWPNPKKIASLNKEKIHYGCIQNDINYLKNIIYHINNKREDGLPKIEIPPEQNTISGGFWICYSDLVKIWSDTYDNRLTEYFNAGYLVKDDQIILADLIFSNMRNFLLHRENRLGLDNWFMFQRHLL